MLVCPRKFIDSGMGRSWPALQSIPDEIAPPNLIGAGHIFQEIPFQAKADIGRVPVLV